LETAALAMNFQPDLSLSIALDPMRKELRTLETPTVNTCKFTRPAIYFDKLDHDHDKVLIMYSTWSKNEILA